MSDRPTQETDAFSGNLGDCIKFADREMSDQEINIAIAEACGWRQSERNIAHWHHVSEPYSHILTGDLPNYCNDLDAMHEAVIKTFQDASMQLDYSRMLIFVIKKSSPICKRFFSDFDLANATARQRAEAFLRMIGKWKETK